METYFGKVCSKHPHLLGKRVRIGSQLTKCVECRKELSRKHWHDNKEKRATQAAEWRKNNPSKITQYRRLREAGVKSAMPKWVSKTELDVIYDKARELGLTVDHVVPLRHPLVCGLHVPWNLQLLSKSENSAKGNKFNIIDIIPPV